MYKYQVMISTMVSKKNKANQGIVIWSDWEVSLTGQWDQRLLNFNLAAVVLELGQGHPAEGWGIQEIKKATTALLPCPIRGT